MEKEALLIIDMVNDFVRKGAPLEVPAARRIVPQIKEKINWARENKIPVIYVCDAHHPQDAEFKYWPSHAVEGTEGAKVVDELSPEEKDIVLRKRRYSAFLGTELELLLHELRIQKLHLTGILTNICILYTAAEAAMRDYETVVYSDCVASTSQEYHNFAIEQMRNVLKVEVKAKS